ncbi:MAG: (2Fe-2S)-binding protein [Lachnospiraceae bacterium]|nr:(2Fe-2S)-binding protein [Robinsoniella sp.]MDY3766213.1 (2Fe-2S)-binding protein [Lachnospiraceae bacterium]
MNKEEIICSCNGVTLQEIEEAVKMGDRTFEDVQSRLRIGKQCIKCKDLASLYIESFVEELE